MISRRKPNLTFEEAVKNGAAESNVSFLTARGGGRDSSQIVAQVLIRPVCDFARVIFARDTENYVQTGSVNPKSKPSWGLIGVKNHGAARDKLIRDLLYAFLLHGWVVLLAHGNLPSDLNLASLVSCEREGPPRPLV